MTRLTLTFSIVAVLAIQGIGLAQQRERERKRDRGQATEQEATPGKTTQDQDALGTDKLKRSAMNRPARGAAGQIDPAILVARMMKEFDADGDQKLDVQELTKLMTAMRDRRQAGRPGAGVGGLPGRNADGDKRGVRSRQGKRGTEPASGKPGGDKPVRPTDK